MEYENDISGDLDFGLAELEKSSTSLSEATDVADTRFTYLQLYRDQLACMGEMENDPFPAWTDEQTENFLQVPGNRACVWEFSNPHGRRTYLSNPEYLAQTRPLVEPTGDAGERIRALLALNLALD